MSAAESQDPAPPARGRLRALVADGVFGWLIVFGLALRVAGGMMPGTGDMNAFTQAGIAAADFGTDCYSLAEGPNVPPMNYPPGAYYTCAVAERLARAARFALPRHFFHNLLMTVFLACALPAIAGFVRRRKGRDAGRLAVLLLWLNPVVLLDSPFLGYMDPAMGVELILGILMALNGSWVAAGLLCGLSMATKPTGFVLVPILAILALDRGGPRALLRAACATFAAIAVTFAPFAAAGTLPRVLVITAHAFKNDCLSCNGLNLWWIVQWLMRASEIAPSTGAGTALLQARATLLPRSAFEAATGIPYWLISLPLVLAASGWIWWRLHRLLLAAPASDVPRLIFEACSVQTLAYVAVSHNVHENHLYLFFLTWPLAAVLDELDDFRWRLRVLGAISALAAYNMLCFYGVGDRGALSGAVMAVLRPEGWPDVSVIPAAMVVLAAAALLRRPFTSPSSAAGG